MFDAMQTQLTMAEVSDYERGEQQSIVEYLPIMSFPKASRIQTPRESIDRQERGYPSQQSRASLSVSGNPLGGGSRSTTPLPQSLQESQFTLQGDDEDSNGSDGSESETELYNTTSISQALGKNVVKGNQYDALPMGNLSKPARSGPGMLSDDLKPGALAAKHQSRGNKGKGRACPGVTGSSGGVMTENRSGTPMNRATVRGDLTNTKLAMNQQVLMEELEKLRSVTERQGLMLERMMTLLMEKERGAEVRATSPVE